MPDDTRVLVVGTTPDYIHWIDQTWPARALFLTDAALRGAATEPDLDSPSEVLVDLSHPSHIGSRLTEHLRRYDLHLGGIACFDCEAMPLTAQLAESFQLPYPPLKAVALCRNKYRSKQVWRAAGIPCPDTRIVTQDQEATAFLAKTGGACVLKPLQGAGSEFVFLCHRPDEVLRAVHEIRQGVKRKKNNLLYSGAGQHILAEAYVPGPEYSCDFVLEEDRLLIIRLARKVLRQEGPLGAVQGYFVPADLPDGISPAHLEDLLARSARALGLSGTICMVDFIMGPNGPALLEMAPRPGGDCLPSLLRHAAGVDMLGLTLDRAEGHAIAPPRPGQWRPCVGMKLYARTEGVLTEVDARRAQADPRVLEIHVKQHPGHRVVLPPLDYDAWLLGHLIFSAQPGRTIESQCEELTEAVQVTMAEES